MSSDESGKRSRQRRRTRRSLRVPVDDVASRSATDLAIPAIPATPEADAGPVAAPAEDDAPSVLVRSTMRVSSMPPAPDPDPNPVPAGPPGFPPAPAPPS
ncbi:MAG: hypothetical protein AAF447_13620, partial [Myxococcota bacterium]